MRTLKWRIEVREVVPLRLLLAGFEDPEVSGQAAAHVLSYARKLAADEETVQGVAVQVLMLPWSHKRAGWDVKESLRETMPDYFLLLGTDPGSAEYKLQVFAANYAHDARPDVDGVSLEDTILDPDGPVAYRSRLPLDGIWDKFLVERVPVRMSHKAGLWVFNHVFYDVMRTVELEGIPTRCGAIELPPIQGEQKQDQGARGTPSETGRSGEELIEEFHMVVAVLEQLSGAVEKTDASERVPGEGTPPV